MKNLFFLLLVYLAALSASADESLSISYKVISGSNIELICCNTTNIRTAAIPQTITQKGRTYTITSIGVGAFSQCLALTSVTIPNSVTSIGESAFENCSNLASVTLPNSVLGIGFKAFEGTALYNDESNWQNNVLYIGNHLIKARENLEGSYIIKAGTVTIADNAFTLCKRLTSVSIPNSMVSIGKSAFENCSNLASVTIPDSVIKIAFKAFEGTALYNKGSNWQNNVLYIGNHLIKAKKNLKGSYTIKSGTVTIAVKAFGFCKKLESVTIPNSVKSIGAASFLCCSLTSVIIPNSVTSIGGWAFNYCIKLESVTVENDNPATISLGSNVFDGVPTSTCVLQVPAGAGSRYAAAYQWKKFAHIEQTNFRD